MFPYLIPLGLTLLSACAVASAADTSDHALEPCINGEVSADGALASAAAARTLAESRRIADAVLAEHQRVRAWEIALEMQLEPCINGEVSTLGTHPSQDLETVAHAFAEGLVTSSHPYYVYMRAGRVIAPLHLLD